jgi:hypothetical protein
MIKALPDYGRGFFNFYTMDYRSNEDYYWKERGYAADIGRGLYNGCTNVVFSTEGSEPVTLNDVKLWGKIDTTADNSLITALIITARIMCEHYTNTSIITRTIAADINNANGGFILPYGPVTSTPTAVDWQGDALTLVYNFSQIQTPYGRMTVTYNAGFATLPEVYKTAIMQQVLYLYEHRGDEKTGMAPMACTLLNPLIRQK